MPASDLDTPANPIVFRQLMGQFATGVAVVSLERDSGGISAMTINSLVSVSLEPMLVSWCLQNSSSQFAVYAGATSFAFSILAEDQQALARRYAARGDSALVPEDFEPGEGGLPVIRGALAHVSCRRFALHDAGDHTLILGAVAGMAQRDAGRRPLVFHCGRFAGLEQQL